MSTIFMYDVICGITRCLTVFLGVKILLYFCLIFNKIYICVSRILTKKLKEHSYVSLIKNRYNKVHPKHI